MHVPQTVCKDQASVGEMGQQLLATGKEVALRRWHEQPGKPGEPHCREHETVGYLVSGRLRFTIDGNSTTLIAGDSWLVPAGAEHFYEILETIVAVEATSPPARFVSEHTREEKTG